MPLAEKAACSSYTLHSARSCLFAHGCPHYRSKLEMEATGYSSPGFSGGRLSHLVKAGTPCFPTLLTIQRGSTSCGTLWFCFLVSYCGRSQSSWGLFFPTTCWLLWRCHSAWCAFLAFRRYVTSQAAAAVGGLLNGFSPYMTAHALGHPNLILAFFPRLVLLILDELIRQQRQDVRLGGYRQSRLKLHRWVRSRNASTGCSVNCWKAGSSATS